MVYVFDVTAEPTVLVVAGMESESVFPAARCYPPPGRHEVLRTCVGRLRRGAGDVTVRAGNNYADSTDCGEMEGIHSYAVPRTDDVLVDDQG